VGEKIKYHADEQTNCKQHMATIKLQYRLGNVPQVLPLLMAQQLGADHRLVERIGLAGHLAFAQRVRVVKQQPRGVAARALAHLGHRHTRALIRWGDEEMSINQTHDKNKTQDEATTFSFCIYL
jgi:hypothetical protein